MSNATNNPRHILVVDDEPTIRIVLRAALDSHGFLVSEAANGQHALRLMDTITFDLVLLDYNMPITDGVSVLQVLQKRAARPPVIMLTAYGSVALATRAMRLGAADFLEKPVVPDELYSCVNNVLAARPVEPAKPSHFAVADVNPNDPAQVQAAIRRALVAKQIDIAETLLQQLSDTFPLLTGSASLLNLKGVINEARGRYLAARALYRMAISADPTRRYSPPVCNAWRLYDQLCGRKPSNAGAVIGDADENKIAFDQNGGAAVVKMSTEASLLEHFALTPPHVPRPTSSQTPDASDE